VGCLLPIAEGDWEEKKWGKKKQKTENKKQKQVSPSEKPMLIRRGADKREETKEKG
jgi:hypothetical protein